MNIAAHNATIEANTVRASQGPWLARQWRVGEARTLMEGALRLVLLRIAAIVRSLQVQMNARSMKEKKR